MEYAFAVVQVAAAATTATAIVSAIVIATAAAVVAPAVITGREGARHRTSYWTLFKRVHLTFNTLLLSHGHSHTCHYVFVDVLVSSIGLRKMSHLLCLTSADYLFIMTNYLVVALCPHSSLLTDYSPYVPLHFAVDHVLRKNSLMHHMYHFLDSMT